MNMSISKPGLASLIIGLLMVGGVWYLAFPAAITEMIIATILGGIVLLGLFLILIGILMLII